MPLATISRFLWPLSALCVGAGKSHTLFSASWKTKLLMTSSAHAPPVRWSVIKLVGFDFSLNLLLWYSFYLMWKLTLTKFIALTILCIMLVSFALNVSIYLFSRSNNFKFTLSLQMRIPMNFLLCSESSFVLFPFQIIHSLVFLFGFY